MNTTPPSPDTDNALIIALIAVLRALADGFAAVYGMPAAMIRGKVEYGPVRERALRWLHDMKCVARRLVLLRALQMEKPAFLENPAEPDALRIPGNGRYKEKVKAPLLDDPATWRVRFSPGAPYDAKWLKSEAPPQRGFRRTGEIQAFVYADDPRPLAEGFEAVLRVVADPDYYAAQLAARIHRFKGRDLRIEKFLLAMCGVEPIFDAAQLAESHWQTFAAARVTAREMLPSFLRAESG